MTKLTIAAFLQKIIIKEYLEIPETEKQLEKNFRQITDSSQKIYTARFLDAEIKRLNKEIKHYNLLTLRRQEQIEARRGSNDLFARIQNTNEALEELQVNRINGLVSQMQDIRQNMGFRATPATPVFKTKEQQIEEVLQKHSESLNDSLQRCKIARKTLQLTNTEQQSLYPTMDSLYKEQVDNRKWYQHGAFAIVLSIIIFPLAPLFYYLWKEDREQEIIQPNAQLSLTEEQRGEIKSNRRSFKLAANTNNYHFPTLKEEKPARPIPDFVTRQKNERDRFFSQDRLFVSNTDIDWVENNKSEDLEERLLLGMSV